MAERRLLSSGIEQLERLVAESPQDRALLQEVLAELAHRSVPRAVQLKRNVEQLLGATAPAPPRNELGPRGSEEDDLQPPGSPSLTLKLNAPQAPSFELPLPNLEASPPMRDAEPPPASHAASVSTRAVDVGVEPQHPAPAAGSQEHAAKAQPELTGAAAIIDKMRKRLLDLTNRNRLLNFKHTAASALRVVDEVPTQIIDRIVRGQAMTFAPLRPDYIEPAEDLELPLAAEPDSGTANERRGRRDARVRELATVLGVNPSFDLPAVVQGDEQHHRDDEIQTLTLPEELYGVLQKLESRAKTAIQETGNNVLHLLFGMVEWSDLSREHAKQADFRTAPLVLVPVRLDRSHQDPDTQTWLYRVSATGEDWDTNATLQEKCRQDFGLEFPGIEDEEKLETYFARVEAWLRENRDHWRLRRQVTLSLVSFGKILMWKDLSATSWSGEGALLDHPLLNAVLGLDTQEAPSEPPARLTAEYPLDEPERVGAPIPSVVMDADSSQHSVLVDAVRGGNLVVQGPPGTGKSQTIANLIACKIASGKKVLFVAEKKAAIDVVYRRLREVGLADYCLQLHSHTSQKKSFLADLNARLAMRGAVPPPLNLDATRLQLQSQREALNRYVGKMNTKIERLGISGFDIMWRSRRIQDGLPPAAAALAAELKIPAVHSMDKSQLAAALSVLEGFGGAANDVISETGSPKRHSWRGVRAPALDKAGVDRVILCAREWRAALRELMERLGRIEALVGGPLAKSQSEVHKLAAAIASVHVSPRVAGSPLPSRILAAGQEAGVARALASFERVETAWSTVGGAWSRTRPSSEQLIELEGAVAGARSHFGADLTHRDVRHLLERLESASRQATALDRTLLAVTSCLKVEVPKTPRIAQRLLALVEKSRRVEASAMKLRSDALWEESGASELKTLAEKATKLCARRAELDAAFPPALAPTTEDLKVHLTALATAPGFLPFLWSSSYRRAVGAYRAATGKKAGRAEMQGSMRRLLEFREDARVFGASIGLERYFGNASSGLDSPFGDAQMAAAWREASIEATRGLGEPGRVLAAAAWHGSLGIWREASGLLEVASANAAHAMDAVRELTSLANDLQVPAEDWLDRNLPDVAAELGRRARFAKGLLQVFESNQALESDSFGILAQRLARASGARAAESDAAVDWTVFQSLGVKISDQAEREEVRDAARLLGAISEAGIPDQVRRWIVSDMPGRRRAELEAALGSAVDAAGLSAGRAKELAAAGEIRWPEWLDGETDPETAPLDAVVARLQLAIASEPTLHTWARYTRFRAQAAAVGAGPICDLVDGGSLAPAQSAPAFECATYSTLADSILRSDPELARLGGSDLEQVRTRFAELDQRFIELTAQSFSHTLSQVVGDPGKRGAYVREYTNGALIEHVAPQAQPRVTIREVFKRASNWLMQMKPCFMMSPQAVAHYLPPGAFEFDVIIMDEASQIRPEDALGAIARAKQMVVVGDPMQLGPTSFFSRNVDLDLDEEDEDQEGEGAASTEPSPPRPRGVAVIEQAESILTAAAARFPMRVLKWHYRSRHPKLIAFSNKEFYGGDLIVFPTPEYADGVDGVCFRAVEGATYDSHVNIREAEAVVEAVRRHAVERPEKTLMIATLNLHQADLIERLLEKAELSDTALAAFRARHLSGPEPLDVKNLENVQGDERDVIYVSITFGPKPDGSFSQGFGPINQAGGERRLNVLFTRAKHRLEVFCSFDPARLRIEANSPRGLQVMANYLKYAQDGKWASGAPTGREPDSDFELAVAKALAAHGLQVQPQVGVAGYRIDIAVHHPSKPGMYVLGVECDGATYHSAKSARDRDRLRETVLRGYGWNIHRIWSTDWFRDPLRQVAAVVEKVQRLSS